MRTALVLALAVEASALAAPSSGRDASLRDLEVKVWTADEHELPALERDVVRLLQINPSSAVAHHLLSQVQVRLFSEDPVDLYLLKQAPNLAQQAVDLDPRSAMGYVALADFLDLMGNPERGIRLLDEAEA